MLPDMVGGPGARGCVWAPVVTLASEQGWGRREGRVRDQGDAIGGSEAAGPAGGGGRGVQVRREAGSGRKSILPWSLRTGPVSLTWGFGTSEPRTVGK